MANIDRFGVSIDSFNELFNAIATEYKTIYGEDINIDQDTPDGQKLSIFVKAYRDLQEFGVDLYNSFDPDTAVGNQLNKLIKLCGISRTPATKSTVNIELTVSQNVTLDSDYTLKDELGQLWVISNPVTLPIGINSVAFIADEWGKIEAQANTITEFETIVLGIDSVTNPSSATAGRDEESDFDLKLRRKKSVALPSTNTIEGLNAKLLNINEVVDAVIYENDTAVYDATLDLNAHSIWCIVDGGLNDNIVSTIGLDKMAGTGLKGSIEDIYYGTIPRQDGTLRNIQVPIRYDRPTETEIYIILDIKAKVTGATLDPEAIKNALATKLFTISENATVTELYSFVYSANNNFIATNLQLSKDNITYFSNELESDFDEKFLITTAKITITEI